MDAKSQTRNHSVNLSGDEEFDEALNWDEDSGIAGMNQWLLDV
jgi:hypothetical protein